MNPLRRPLPRTLRWRLMLWFALLLATTLGLFGLLMYQSDSRLAEKRFDESLAVLAEDLSTSVRDIPMGKSPGMSPPPKPPGDRHDFDPQDFEHPESEPPPPPPGESGTGPADFGGRDESILQAMSHLRNKHPGTEMSVFLRRSGKTLHHPANGLRLPVPAQEESGLAPHFENHGDFRICYQYTEMSDAVLLAARPLSVSQDKSASARQMLATGSTILLIGLSGAWWILIRSLRPIRRIEDVSQKIADGRLSERIGEVSPGSELGDLANTLDRSFAKLEANFEQQKRFVSDASHELRTPLAVIITEIQATLAHERTASEYREVLQGNLETSLDLKRLTENLLELARLDAGSPSDDGMEFDLGEVVSRVIQKCSPLARRRNVTLHFDGPPEMAICGHPFRLALTLANLVENAIHHSSEGGAVSIEATRSDTNVEIIVRDQGSGIAPEDLPHIFERFYRGDKARHRSEGRYGLGLAICQSMIHAERGNITVESTLGKGTTFHVILPIMEESHSSLP